MRLTSPGKRAPMAGLGYSTNRLHVPVFIHRVFYNHGKHGNVRGMDGGGNMAVAADCLAFSWMRIRDLEFRRYKVSRWQVYGTSSELSMGVLGNLSDDIS